MIEKIAIRNYKSLEDVELELGPLTVLVGPNNSGKSNILDCLRLESELVSEGPGAVHARGGFSSIVWNGQTKRTISARITGYFSDDAVVPSSIRYEYALELVGSETHFNVLAESLTAHFEASRARPDGPHEAMEKAIREAGPDGRKLLQFPGANPGMANLWNPDGSLAGGVAGKVGGPCLTRFLAPEQYPVPECLAREIASWGFYNLVPSHMKSPVPARKDLTVQSAGDNLSAVVHSIHSEHTEEFKEIESLLRTAVPEARQLLTALTEQGQTFVSIQEEHLNVRVPSMSMSDGTLRLLAHLAALYSPDRPPLMCFEEPENYVHPHLLELLANVLKTASNKTQVLITTHSPYFLNWFDIGSLVVVSKAEGKTQLTRAKDIKGAEEAIRKLGLGELWYAGSLGGVPE